MYYHPLIEEIISGGNQTSMTLIFLLSIPLIFTILNFFRYFVGLKSISIYGSLASIFLFNSLGSTLSYTSKSNISIGLTYGIILITVVFVFIILVHSFFKNMQLHYYPKMSIILMGPVIALFLSMLLARRLSDQVVIQMEPLNIVLIAIIAEQMLSVYTKHGLKSTFTIIFQSIIVSGICYILISNPLVQENLLLYPWLMFILIPLNMVIGKYTGLRLTEYVRFYDLLVNNGSQKSLTDENTTNDNSNTEE